MGDRLLLGVPVPDGALRVIIRPILGRGGALALYESALTDPLPTETEIIAAASRNRDFWEYIDAQVKASRIAEGACSWKLQVEFFNQLHVKSSHSTEQAFEFYRAVSAARGGSPESALFELALRLVESSQRSSSRAVRRITKYAERAIAETVKACAAAQAEATKAGGAALAEASKQTAVVGELAKDLLTEASELKQGIFELQTERAKPAPTPPKSLADDLKDLHATAKTVMGLADAFAPAPSPTPAASPTDSKPTPEAPRPDGPAAEK